MTLALLWIPATLIAICAQTARNTLQHGLTQTLGTLGATQVRFLYGLPFALLFMAMICLASGQWPPVPRPAFLAYAAGGAVLQILATALMLAAMREKAFSLAIAYTKTEAIQVALFGLLFLGDRVGLSGALAIALTSLGIMLMSFRPGGDATGRTWQPALMGIAAGGFFALSAICFRGAILSLDSGSFLMRATTALSWSLAIQTLLLLGWLGLRQRAALLGSLRVWRASLLAGFMGALASQFWFIGFALTAAANVRTLGLLEVLVAQLVSRRFLAQHTSRREVLGLAAVVLGVGLLVANA